MPAMEYHFECGRIRENTNICFPREENEFIKIVKKECRRYYEEFDESRLIRFSPPWENCARKRIVVETFDWPLNSRRAKETNQLSFQIEKRL